MWRATKSQPVLRAQIVIDQRHFPLGTWRCCDVESTSLTLIQRRNNVVCQVDWLLKLDQPSAWYVGQLVGSVQAWWPPESRTAWPCKLWNIAPWRAPSGHNDVDSTSQQHRVSSGSPWWRTRMLLLTKTYHWTRCVVPHINLKFKHQEMETYRGIPICANRFTNTNVAKSLLCFVGVGVQIFTRTRMRALHPQK